MYSSQDINSNESNGRYFSICEQIGQGRFATVYKGKWSRNGAKTETVAIKIQPKEEENKKASRVKNEIQLHQSLKHHSIIKIKDAFVNNNEYFIILEYCNIGTLDEYLKKHKLSVIEVYSIMKQVVDGLKYLHFKNIIHRDLSLKNILLTKCPKTNKLQVKIADFGQSTKLSTPDDTKQTFVGTPVFMSPELLTGNRYGFAIDIWGLGIILYALMFGDLPIRGQSIQEVFERIRYEDIEIPSYPDIEAQELVSVLLNKESKERPNIYEISNHRFFQKYEQSRSSRSKLDYYSTSNDSGTGTMSAPLPATVKEMPYNLLDTGISSHNPERNFPLSIPENREDYYQNSKFSNSVKNLHKDSLKNVQSYGMPTRKDHLKNLYRLPSRNFENITNPVTENWSAEGQIRQQKNEICLHPEKRCYSNPDLVNRDRSYSPSASSEFEKEDRRKFILNTKRLPPSDKKAIGKNTGFYINSDGQAVAECYKTKRGTKFYIKYVLTVSPNGKYICVSYPSNKKHFIVDASIQNQDFFGESDLFSVMNLPDEYWRKYKNLKQFIDVKKSKTPKITIYSEQAKCVMMENFPDPNFELTFTEGLTIIKDGSKLFKIENECKKIVTREEISEKKLSHYDEMTKKCHLIHSVLSPFEENGEMNIFPAKFGNKTLFVEAVKQHLSKIREYPQSNVGSGDMGENIQISYSNSIDSISTIPSDQKKINDSKSCSEIYEREIKDSIANISSNKKIVYIKYKDGYEVQSTREGKEVKIHDIRTRKRITEWRKYPHLKKKINYLGITLRWYGYYLAGYYRDIT